ncbi:MAG TPA: NAD(P)-dependent oxidoreductase [Tepidisphaeraceae bacterium]|nr:NAD(P)-dependent oxidoreductase [Tepidisphaeraceae bacterium]
MANSNTGKKPPLGFIGLGAMGSRMAGRLLEAGYPLTVYNRTREKAYALAERGARVVNTPREVAADAEFILSSVTDDSAIEIVMFGPDGALAGAQPGAILIDTSTISPHTVHLLYETAVRKGAMFIDAAVSGSIPQAERGELVIFAGGEQLDVFQSKLILEVLGKCLHVGPSGFGAMTKLVVNAVLGVSMQALAEAIALGEKAGLDRKELFDVLGQTGVVSPLQKAKLDSAKGGQYPPGFPLRLMVKDFNLIFREAVRLSVPMPVTAVAQQLFAIEFAKKHAEEDFSAAIRSMEEMAAVPPA